MMGLDGEVRVAVRRQEERLCLNRRGYLPEYLLYDMSPKLSYSRQAQVSSLSLRVRHPAATGLGGSGSDIPRGCRQGVGRAPSSGGSRGLEGPRLLAGLALSCWSSAGVLRAQPRGLSRGVAWTILRGGWALRGVGGETER